MLAQRVATVIIYYWPSCCSKPVWVSVFCWTQKNIFWRISITN